MAVTVLTAKDRPHGCEPSGLPHIPLTCYLPIQSDSTASCQGFHKLPKLFDMDMIRKKFGTDISPTSVVLLQELERFNKLVVRMQRSLAELQKVRRGATTYWENEQTRYSFVLHTNLDLL